MKLFRNYKIYTDGGCHLHSENSPGAHALVVYDENNNKIIEFQSEIELNTTNNIQELKAVLRALKLIRAGSWRMCTIYTDSQYVQKGINEWLPNWKNNKWKNSTGKIIENLDLWKEIDNLSKNGGKFFVEWIKGHDISKENCLVDSLCTKIINEYYENK